MNRFTIIIIGAAILLIVLICTNIFHKRYVARRRCSVMVSAEITGKVAITNRRLSLKVAYFYMEKYYKSVTADWVNDGFEYEEGKCITIWIDPDDPNLCLIRTV